MKQISRYLARQILLATVVSTVCLSLAFMLIQSVRLVELIVQNGLSLGDFAVIALLALPRYLPMILPLTLFGATLFTYNRMINDSEIVVLQSAGMSRAMLAKPGLLIGLLFVMVGYSLTLYFSPLSYSVLRTKLLQARSHVGALMIKEGQFSKLGDKVTVFVREKNTLSDLRDVFIHSQQDEGTEITIIAEKGAFIETEQGPRVIAINGTKQSIKDGKIHILKFDRSTVDLGIDTSPTGKRWVDPEERYLWELFNPDLTDPSNRQHYNSIIVEGHKRLLTPFLCLLCVIIALETILGRAFSRKSQIVRVVLASGLAVGVYILNIMLTALAVRAHIFIPLLYLNIIIPTALGLVLLAGGKKIKSIPPNTEFDTLKKA